VACGFPESSDSFQWRKIPWPLQTRAVNLVPGCTVMVDVHTKAQRSHNMSRVRSQGNRTTEACLAGLFRKWHVTGWRRGVALCGKPDFVFPQSRVVVFVDGCFWHNCQQCKFKPSSNVTYWEEKFARNRARDEDVNRTLKVLGWRVIRIWEHELRDPSRIEKRLQRLNIVATSKRAARSTARPPRLASLSTRSTSLG
jgi:DNA mismatch endonuclease, patch repair protein